MTPIEKRNQILAEKMIKNLRRRNMEAFYCPTAQDAVAQVQALIADGSSVTWGGSMTIRDMGLPQALRERGTLEVLDRDLVEDAQEKQQMYLKARKGNGRYLNKSQALKDAAGNRHVNASLLTR